MTFLMTLLMYIRSISCLITKKLPNSSVSVQQSAFDTHPKEDLGQPLQTTSVAETELLSSVLNRLSELEEKVNTLELKPSEMPYEKVELLNAAVYRVDALEAELIATKKVPSSYIFNCENPTTMLILF